MEERIKELEEELVRLREELKKEHEYERWRAEVLGGEYYLLDIDAGFYEDGTQKEDGIGIAKSFDYRKDLDVSRYEIGNYFKTEEEAKQKLEYIKTEQQLKDIALRLNKGVEIDWESKEQSKWYIYYRSDSEKVYTDSFVVSKHLGAIYCLSEDFKDTAIAEIGEDNLIEYLKEC